MYYFHMETMILLNFVIFTALFKIPIFEFKQLCSMNATNICYLCTSTMNCKLIGNEMKVIRSTNRNTIINYGTYVGGHVKIIEEPEVVTFYSCLGMTARGDKTGYLQVNPFTYHPINHELEFRNYPLGRNFLKMSTRFQKCLNSHCLHNNNNNNNRLECADLPETRLDFEFSDITTLECVQNITFAHLSAPNVTVLRENHFFRNAYNIIYLKLNLQQLTVIECSTFERLKNLRLLRFNSDNIQVVENYECIFDFNENLVALVFNDKWIWNSCQIDYRKRWIFSIFFSCVTISTVMIWTAFCTIFRNKFTDTFYENATQHSYENLGFNGVNFDFETDGESVSVAH